MLRWLLTMAALALASPLSADELRPVSIMFEQVGEDAWELGWREPILAQSGRVQTHPLLPESCRIDGDPDIENARLVITGRAAVRCDGALEGQTIGWSFTTHSEAILRVAPLRQPLQVHRLTPVQPSAVIEAQPSSTQVWRSYFVIGVEHILAGWDHLLFVIALVLLVGSAWPVVKAATAFTIAHSITLAAVTLGFAGLPQRPVEMLIALSIVFLAVEIARGSRDTLTRRLPWLVAFAFGLVHGFGFAGALREIGLPEGEVPAALISFNLGVEAGQLLVIAIVLGILALLRRLRPAAEAASVKAASYAIGIIGAYWLFDRVMG